MSEIDQPTRAAVFNEARNEHLLPLLLFQLERRQSHAHEELAALIRPDVLAARPWSLLQARATVDVIKQFERANIEAKVIKGQLLAKAIYGDPASKSSSDIDVIVRSQQVAKAAAQLRASGYECALNLAWFSDKSFLSLQKEASFACLGGAFCVDLHWGLVNRWNARPVTIDEIFEPAPPLFLFGAQVPWYRLDVLWRIQLGHLISSGWDGLKTFVDFVHVTDRLSESELEQALLRCESLGALDQAIAAIRVNEALFKRPIPVTAEVFAKRAASGRMDKWVHECVSRLGTAAQKPAASAVAKWWRDVRLSNSATQLFATATPLWTPAMVDYEQADPPLSGMSLLKAMMIRRALARAIGARNRSPQDSGS